MALDEIKFKISADMDFGDAKNQVELMKKGILDLQGAIGNMPNVSKILDNSLEKTASIATSLSNKLDKLRSGNFRSDSERAALEKSISNDVSELNTLRSLQSGQGDFSVSLAKSWFGDLPNAVQRELDLVIPKVASIIKTRTSSLSGGNRAFNGKTQTEIASQAIQDPEVKALASRYLKSQMSRDQFKQIVQDIIPHIVPASRLNGYQVRRYGSVLQNEATALAKGNVVDLFPQSYRNAYNSRGYVKRKFAEQQGGMVLDANSVKELNQMLATRPIMAKAAITSGISRRNGQGILETKREISRQEWENYRSALYDELMTRAAGYGKNKVDPYSIVKEDVKKLTSRLTSSTSGDTMTGMHDIEKFENAQYWTTGTGSKKYSQVRKEGRRAMDEYVVRKYSPFLRRSNGTEVSPQEVMINESHNTRLLGGGKWKNNDDVSDTISLISLAGYDPKNKEHQAQLLDLYRNGRVIDGKQYIAQSTHGKGEDQVVRMIEKSAYDRVAKQEEQWARTRHIRGSYWGGFNDAEIQRKIDSGEITAKDWGKHLEMQNKAWTPSVDAGLNLSKKRIAVVDFKGAGDGATWVSNKMMADSGQVRFGVGGKGSAFVFDGKNVGEFGRRTGIADENGRVMMPGPDGKLYDVSGYDMVVPLDAIKNQGAYKDENGNFYSGERASEIATALGRRYGIGMVANYSKEDISSNKIGTQMASFINFNPAVRDYQIEMAMQRMRELDTETGQLKYVFGDQNDWLSRKVNEDTQLLNTEAAKRRVDSYKQSLMNRLAGGEYINFDNDSGIADMRLVASPLAAYLTATGGIKDGKVLPSVITKAREYLGENSDKYTDAEISNMIVPDKDTVLDFAHKDKDQVAVIRSPTGYGNMVHARNVAAAAEPIYKGFGITTNAGIYVSDQQLQTLQSADFDADQAKVIFNDALRQSVEETLKTQHYEEASVPKRTVEYSKEELADKNLQQVYFADRGAVMSSAMGAGSSGIRIMQLDLSKPSNQQYIKEAQRLADYYDTWTTHNKNAEEADIEDANAWGTFRLAKEYTKFSDNLNKFVMKEDEIPEELSEADIFKASNGKIINLKALRDLGIDNVNLPAAYMANHVMGVAAQNNLYRNGGVDTTYMDAIGEAMQQMDYGDAGPARQKLMKTMRSLLTQFGTGERAMLSPPETRALSAMTENAMNELVEDSRKYLDPATGKYVYKNERGEIKSYDTEQRLAEARAKNYGIITARNAIGSFGMTEDRLYNIFGNDYSKKFANASLSNIELLPEDKLATEIKEQQENISDEIKAAQKEVSNETGSRKRSNKKKTTQQKLIEKQIDNLGKQLGVKATDDIEQLIEGQEIALKTNIAGFNYANDEDKPTFSNAIQENKDRIKGLQEYKNLLKEKESLSKSPAQKRLDELLAQKAELDKQEQMALKTIDARTEYQSIIGAANEYATQMWAYQKGKENKINDSKSYAEKYYSKSDYERSAIFKTFDEFTDKISNSDLPKETIDEFQNGMNSARAEINKNVEKDFTNKAILYAKSLSENLEDELNKNQNAPSAQKRKIDSFNEQIDNAKSFTAFMNEKLTSGKLDPAYQKLYEDAVKSANEYIEASEGTKEQLIGEYTKQNESSARLSYENLSIKYGLKSRNSLGVRSEARKREISNLRDVVNKQHNEGYFSEEEYSNITAQLDTLEQKSSEVSIAVQDMMNKTSMVINRVMQRLGRQLFMKALQETKRFVKEFDASMNEIQAITLKSNDQMASVRSNTISKALGLRTSVSNVATTEAALYRQGLSDAEVSSRTESIIKFATVTKLNVADATKIITTALQNDLVPSAEQAMDALVALGDSAATTAAEIGKGMQKAAASAKVAGVSYAELTALLTVGTSDTQLSGTQVGTALQTVFTRMRKMSLSGWTADQNGEKTTASDAEAALRSVGVDLFEDKNQQKMRSAYSVLSDLAKIWQKLSDVQKSVVTNALAGTRQTNIFSTLMEGMSEDDGKRMQEYLDLASNSSGITQSKYEIAMQSLAASLDELRSSWDALVESFITGGSVTGILDGVSGALQWIANIGNNGGQVGIGLAAIAGGLTAIFTAIKLAKSLTLPGFVMTLIELLAGGAVAGGVLGLTGLLHSGAQETESERLARESSADLENINKSYTKGIESLSNKNKLIDTAQTKYDDYLAAQESGNKITVAQAKAELISSMSELGKAFPSITPEIQNATTNLDKFSGALDSARDAAEKEAETLNRNNDSQVQQHQEIYGQREYDEASGNEIISGFDYGQFDREAIKYIAESGGMLGYQDENGNSVLQEFVNSFADSQNFFKGDEDASGNKARALTSMYKESPLGRRILGSYFKNDENILSLLKTDPTDVSKLDNASQWQLASAYDNYWRYRFNLNFDDQENYQAQRRLFNDNFVSGMLDQWNLSDLTTDTVGENAIRGIFLDKLFQEMTDESGEYKSAYLSDKDNQILNVSAVSSLIRTIKGRGTDSLLEGYTPEEINSYKTTVDNAVSASLINLRKNYPLNQQRNDLLNAIANSSDLASLKSAYESEDKAQEFANVLANSPELLSAYMMITEGNGSLSWNEFQRVAQTTRTGYSKPTDTAKVAINALSKNSAYAAAFREDDAYSGVYKTLQTVFGELTDEILNAYAEGNLSKDLQNYIDKTLTEKGLKTGTGKQYTGVETANLATALLSGNFSSWTSAQQGMKDWTTDEWNAIANKYPALKQYMEMSPEQQASQEGQNLYREFSIQLSVAGVSDLENANKILEGTTSLIENLQKGGEISLKARIDYGSTLFNNRQQEALLENGSFAEQLEAISAITGLSNTQIQDMGITEARVLANSLIQHRRANTASSLNEIARRQGTTEADRLARLAGYKNVGNSVEDVLSAFSGQTGLLYRYDAKTDTLYEGSKQAGKQLKDHFDSLIQPNYQAITDENGNPVRENLAFGLTRQRTATEIARNRAELINGQLDYNTPGRYEEYAEAFNSLGENGRNYFVALEEMQRLESSGAPIDAIKAQEQEIARLRKLAAAENANALREAEEQEALRNASLNQDTFGGALAYANLQYQQNNRARYAADTIYKTLSTGDFKSVEDLSKAVEESDVQNWKDLLASSEDVRKAFEQAGVKVNEETGEIDWSGVENSADGVTNALNILMQAISQTSETYNRADYATRSDIYNQAMQFAGDPTNDDYYNAYASIVGSDMANRRAAMLANPDNADYVFNALEGTYSSMLMDNYQKGFNGLTVEQQAYGAQALLDSLNNKTFKDEYGDASQDMLNAFTENTPVLREYIQAVQDGTKEESTLAEMAKEAAAEIAGIAASSKGFGESSKRAKEFATAIEKGGAAAAKAKTSLDAEVMALQDQQTALTNASGKSGKQLKAAAKKGDRTLEILSGMFSYDADQIAEFSTDKIQELIDQAQPIIAENFGDIVNSLYEALPDDVDVSVPLGDLVHMTSDGQIDLSDVEATLGSAAADIVNMIMQLAQTYGRVDLEAVLNNKSVDIKAFVSELSKAGIKARGGGGYSRGKSSGGGGGGKSAADKMLDVQKQRIANLDHVSKMLEIQEKYYDFVNDYSGYSNNIDQQVQNQERLRSAYAQNLEELKAQLAVVGQGTDDYNKLADAIRSTEESLASVNNTINELQAKKINIVAQQQENEDKPVNHQLAMLQKYAQRYQRSGQFESYVAIMEKTLQTSRHQIAVNNSQIKQWEGMLKEYYEGSDSWLEIRDKIWALKEENAELENQIASDLIELEEAKVAQIAQDLQNNNLSFDHVNNMLDMYGEMYQSTFNHQGYRSTLGDINENNVKMKEATDEAIEQVKQQIATMKTTDPARQTAIQTLYELEEASARYEADILKNRQAIEESFITEITQSHGDSSSIFEHEFKLLQEAEKSFMRDKDFVNYENIVKEEARNASERLAEQRSALEDYLALQDSGKITYGSQQWRSLEEQIRSTKENIASLSNEYEELLDRVESVRFENLQRNFSEIDELAQHNLKMIQYEETRYQNRGELTNYGTLLAQDTDMQRERAGTIQQYIDDLKAQQAELQDNPELYDKISQEIYKWEENLSQVNNQIEKNVKLLKKNEEAIRKARQAVENVIDKEIRARIQKERDMLSATVSIENSIVDIIRQRYQNEWKLMKDDLNKKKQALNDEKGLINERLNARKEAIQKEEKYEELAELQRQLALISADPTRTKEAKELRKKIADLQKDISWDIATDEANTQIEAIDDQIKAIDDYASTYEEDLNEMLSNSNNFRDEMDSVMGGSFEDFVNWMKQNNEAYKKSTDEARQQMEWGWEDTWKKMKDELDTYWNEVDETMRSKEGFIEYMQNSDTYRAASETGQKGLIAYWSDMYDDYTASLIDNANFDHTHEIIDKISELQDWTFNVRLMGQEGYDIQSLYSQYGYDRDHSVIAYTPDTDYAGIGKKYEPPAPAPAGGGGGASGGTSGPSSGKRLLNYSYVDASATIHKKIAHYSDGSAVFVCNENHTWNGALTNGTRCSKCGHVFASYTPGSTAPGTTPKNSGGGGGNNTLMKYASGGLVDYTGPAWVDGSKTHPEAFLDPDDTALLRAMLDQFTYVKNSPYMTNIDTSKYGNTNISVGDVNVNLYEAKLENDADYDLIAQKVGNAFTKQLQKDGFNLAGYAW